MSPVKLRVSPAEGDPYDFTVEQDSVIIGRSSSADLTISDPSLSRQHARLVRNGETLTIEDLGSRNGTCVNDAPVEGATLLKKGDVIRLSASSIAVGADRVTLTHATIHDTDPGSTIFRPAKELLEEETGSSTNLMESAEALRRYAERLEILRDVHEALGGSVTQEELLTLILDRVFDHLKPQRGAIFLKEEDGEFYSAAARAVPGESENIGVFKTLVSEVLDKGMAALVFDVRTDARFSDSDSIMMSGIRSMVAAPLLDAQGAMGMIVLDSKVAVRKFSEEDMGLLVSLASVAALKIRNIALTEEAVQRRQLEREVELARGIQLKMLPAKIPVPPGYAILGRNIPARGVSGDYYVVVERFEGKECLLFLADVSGKGIPACIVTASLDALATGPIEIGDPPDEICRKTCRRLHLKTDLNKYATAFVASLEHKTGRLTYTNAGHNAALVARDDGAIERLGASGMPIGIFPEGDYELRETRLEPGAGLFVYTDGITEAENPDEDEYGIDRLAQCYSRHCQETVEEIADAIEDDLAHFASGVPYFDDRTFVIVKRLA